MKHWVPYKWAYFCTNDAFYRVLELLYLDSVMKLSGVGGVGVLRCVL